MNINFHHSYPIFRVRNLENSLHYYQDKLNFSVEWIHENKFASVTRGNANIMLCKGDQGQGKAWMYIGIGDSEKLFEEYKLSGAILRQNPTNFSWALEMQIEDIDRNGIRFGSEPKENFPFGPWLDKNGKIWN